MAIDWVGAAISGVISLITVSIAYGILSEKVRRIEHDIEKIDEEIVTKDLFQSVVYPIRETVTEVGRDIKKIMSMLNRNKRDSRGEDE